MTTVAAEAFHPSTFIKDELEAREWSIGDLAKLMPGDYGINHLALDLYLNFGPGEPYIRMNDMAVEISNAFGVDPDLFTNLEKAWVEHRGYMRDTYTAWAAPFDAEERGHAAMD